MTAQTPSSTGSSAADSVQVTISELADRIIDEAKLYLGTPYRRGGNGPKVFDCTGFTKFIFGKFGYELGRTVPAQAVDGREMIGSLADLQKGDLLIFGARGNPRRQGHAGIFIGMDSTGTNFSFIHAAVHGGITISNLNETYYKKRFLGARRILPDFLPAVTDTTAVAVLDSLSGQFVPQADTLQLSPADRRIILFADGTWALVDSTGAVAAPASQDRILLAENGSWRTVTSSTVQIPDLKKPEPQTQKTTGSSSTKTTAPPPPADGSAVYHTIVSGDTLYGLARRYGTTVSNLCALNGITTKTTLRPGKKLRVR